MNNKKVLNVNNNDQYFGNSIPSSPIKRDSSNTNLSTIAAKLLSNFKLDSDNEDNNNDTSVISQSNNLNTTYDDSDNSYDSSELYTDHYKDNFFHSVLKDIKEHKEMEEQLRIKNSNNNNNNNSDNGSSFNSYSSYNSFNNSINTYESFKNILNIKDSNDILYDNNNNNSNNNNNNIVLVNSKNLLSNSNVDKNSNNKNKISNNKKKKRKPKSNIMYTEKEFQLYLNKIKKDADNCGREFGNLLLNVGTICDNIGKISSSNMKNYSNTIDGATFEIVKVAETMKMLINSLELLNSDMFEMYRLNNQVKNVKKDIDQLESLVLKLINNNK